MMFFPIPHYEANQTTRWNAHEIAIHRKVLNADEVRQIDGWKPRVAAVPKVV